jgi:YggT family protein
MGGLDLSPMLVILGIFFLQNFVVRTVSEIGYRLKSGGLL